MRIAEALDMAERYIRAQPSTNPVMVAFRGEDTIAIVEVVPNNRNKLLHVAAVMAGGYGADVLVFVTDTYTSTLPVNPVTGEEWGENELGILAREHDGIAKGWVSDSMVAHVINRAGDQAVISMPYRMENDEHVWGEATRLVAGEDGQEVGGALADGFAHAMNAPQLAVVLAQMGSAEVLGDAETTQAVIDCSVTERLMGYDFVRGVAMPAEEGTVRTGVIKRFLRSMQERQS